MQELIKNRLLSITAFITISLSVIIIILTPPTSSYEISIYNMYPAYFWVMLTLPILILFYKIIFLDMDQFKFKNVEIKKDIIISILAALLSLSIFILLPFFRDYFLYSGGDPISHLTYIKDISSNGHFEYNNVYPIIHLIIYSISVFTGVNSRIVIVFLPLIFNTLFIISMYLFSKSLKFNIKESLFVILFSMIPVLGTELLYTVPSVEAFSMVPLILFVLVKSRLDIQSALKYSIVLLVLFILLVFFHPETTIFLLIILLSFQISIVITKRLSKRGYSVKNDIFVNIRSMSSIFLFLIITFFLWFSSSLIFGNTVNTVYDSLILNLGVSQVATYSQMASKVNLGLYDFFILLIKIYGPILVYVGFSAIVVLFGITNFLYKKKINARNLFLSVLFIILGFSSLLFLFKDLLIGGRPIKFLILISILLMSIFFDRILKYMHYNKYKIIPLVLSSFLIIAVIGISFLNTYPSPFINKYNYEVMSSDMSGVDFFFTKKDQSLSVLSLTVDLQRYGYYVAQDHRDIKMFHIPSNVPPDHFGYDQGKILGDYYDRETYMVFNALTTRLYPEVYPKYKNVWRFNPQDFSNIKNDQSINRIYDNSNIVIFEVN